ncbi:MAG TPA: hypothetical protein PLP25_03055, partial [Candidatus Limiplasma sp.]|nr:hypothetical protein [Candidatus Limiplasma sp.]
VMENLLGRTVVAEDLDSGIEIMRAGGHAFRLVTLAGDVMHSGGSMTGGSIQQKAQNLLGREREIKELAATLQSQTEQASQAVETLTAMEAERTELREKRAEAREALKQQEIAVVRDTERQHTAQNEMDEHTRATEGVRQAIAQLDESLADVEAELKRIEALTGQGQMDADAMKAKTATLSETLDKARREREAAQEALTQALLNAQEAEHQCDRLRRDKRRLLGDIETCRQEQTALTEKQTKALADVETAKRERVTAAETVATAQTGVDKAKAHVDELENRREEAQKTLRDVYAELEAGRALSEKTTERLHRQEMNLSRVKGDMTLLNDRLWDTYELTYAGAKEAHAEYVLLRQRAERPDALSGAVAPAGAEPCQTSRAAEGEPAAASEPMTADGPGEGEEPLTGDSGAEAEGGSAAQPASSAGFDEAAADRRAQEIRERIRRMGNVNVGAIEEYAQLRERATDLTAQRDDLERAKQDLQALIQNLLEHMRTVFVGQFGLLQGYFEETFIRLFGGGHGEIRLADPEDPLNCGIDIIVQPPGKKRQILSLFSGGERALTAIAILFAMLKLKPTPFCILDEIEAALDEANITYFADYLKEFSEGTQFIVVTHRKGTMERCDTLFGVAMEERGVSSMVSVSLKDYE